MNLKELLQKIAEGKELAKEEKDALVAFDPDKVRNEAAAAARKEAEAKAKAAQDELQKLKDEVEKAKADADAAAKDKMTEGEKLAAQIADLTKSISTMKAEKAEADKALATASRAASISSLREKLGIRFIDGVDKSLLGNAFASALDGVENLDDETLVGQRIEAFKSRNKALIFDAAGGGTGDDFQPSHSDTQPLAVSDADRVAQLEKNGSL